MASGEKKSNLDKWLALKNKSAKTAQKPVGISKAPPTAVIPLSRGQERLWLLQQLYADNPFYNYGHRYQFTGSLVPAQLLASFKVIAKRHQLLEVGFVQQEDGQVIQQLLPERELPAEQHDLSHHTAATQQAALQDITEHFLASKFKLAEDVLLRLCLVKLSDTSYQLLLLMHHIIGDRASLQVLNQEVAQHYQAAVADEGDPLGPLDIQYTDYAYWQRQQQPKAEDLAYWLRQLSGDLPLLELPADYPRPASPLFQGKTLHKSFSPELSEQLRQLAGTHNTTLFVLGLAAFKVLLHRYTSQTDILIGVPFSNRDKAEFEKLIGFFNETLVLRTDLTEEPSFEQLLHQLKQTTLEAFSHRTTPFDLLVQQLKPQRQGTSNPLFQAMFVYNEAGQNLDFGADVQLTEQSLDLGITKFDLTLFLGDTPSGLQASLEFATDIFATDTMERMLGHLEMLLTEIVSNPQGSITTYALLPASEKKQILETWNDTTTELPAADSILDLFEQNVRQYPDKQAVAYGEEQLTYAELSAKVNAVARRLQEMGELKNRLIGLYVTPGTDLLVGILAIQRARAAYLPLDPNYPAERIIYMLADAEVGIVLTQKALLTQLPTHEISVLTFEEVDYQCDSQLDQAVVGTDLAYMIYTSGSTGQPKGVAVSHQNLLSSTAARFHFYDHQPGAFLLLSSFSFDSSVAGIFWAISSGGCLVLAPKGIEQDIGALAEIIERKQITHTLMLPSLYSLLLEFSKPTQLQSLQAVMVAGEACYPDLLRQHLETVPKARLYNEYGPTEGTVWSTAHLLTEADLNGNIPIGRPIPNATNYILDRKLQAVPIGVVGELYIGGEGITNGYWKRDELTTERFLPNPFGEGRLYKTGDRVRYRPDGLIDFLGRVDYQVKIRGHRVELGEIKRLLLKIPLVQDAVVLLGDNQRLMAYLLADEQLNVAGAKHWLTTQLPEYMVPTGWVVMSEFPRLPNGKVDIDVLSDHQETAIVDSADTAPTNELEQQLLDIWKQVLKTDRITVLDNFFELGGDSLRSISIIAKAQKLDIPLAPNHLFEHQSIRDLATFLNGTDEEQAAWSSITPLQKGTSERPLFCVHSGAAHVFFYRGLATHLGEDASVYALQPQGLDGKLERHESIEEMAAFYIGEIKKVQPEGPYTLLGTCFSNAVGLEMAHQLKKSGEEIAHLIFVDSAPAHLTSLRKQEGKRTLHRFSTMLKNGDWPAIAKKIRNRFIVASRKMAVPFKDNQAQELQHTIDNLNELYARYDWEAFDGQIIFIRSSEFAARPDKNFHLEQWTELTKGELKVYEVPGHHLTLFEEPEVEGLAKVLGEVLG